MKNLSRIQYISNGRTQGEQLVHIQQALDAGAEWIQLRWKEGAGTALFELAEKVRALTQSYGAILVVNDWLRLAQAIDADGLHLGLEDGSIENARKLLGNEKILGGTANTFDHIKQRTKEQCDYIGLGPLRYTTTKRKLSPLLNLGGYQEIVNQLAVNRLSAPPLFAIGGVLVSDVQRLLDIGIYGVAISSLINKSPETLPHIKQHYENNINHRA